MNRSKNIAALALAVSVSAIAVTSASAQNPFFQSGDLIMGFQLKQGNGSDRVVMLNLGDTATIFRDATGSINNVANVGALLDQTFGLAAGNSVPWYENTNLFFGAAGAWSNANPPDALQNGDPQQTVYMSKSRTAVGNELVKNSTLVTPSSSNQIFASNNIVSLNGAFESQLLTPQGSLATSLANTWEDFTPTSTTGAQSTAFTAFTGGIQQKFLAGSYGTFSNGAVEGALDLYRGQAVNDIAGQAKEGGAIRVPQFQGILTIDQAGEVDFVVAAVPEPSSALLIGAASLIGVASRRRRSVAA